MNITRLALGSLLLAVVQLPAAQAADPAVGRQLEERSLKYEIDEDGDYKLLFTLDKGRSQLVWVRSATETLGSLRIREILSIGGKMPDTSGQGIEGMAMMAALSVQALRESSGMKLGGWVLKGEPGENEAFYYVAQIDADAKAADLEAAVRGVARAADAFEQQVEELDENGKTDVW